MERLNEERGISVTPPPDSGLPRCLRNPIPEIADAAGVLSEAVKVHLRGEVVLARRLIGSTNTEAIRRWVESLWGKHSAYVMVRTLAGSPPQLPRAARERDRMPTAAQQRDLFRERGHHCRFCGIPVLRVEIRQVLHKLYPVELPWGRSNLQQHAAFQAMWMQFDHILPHSRGGTNDLGNVVIACAPCNYARMNYTLEEVGLEDPRNRSPIQSDWDGLEEIMASAAPAA